MYFSLCFTLKHVLIKELFDHWLQKCATRHSRIASLTTEFEKVIKMEFFRYKGKDVSEMLDSMPAEERDNLLLNYLSANGQFRLNTGAAKY